jgi:hypothetical protein
MPRMPGRPHRPATPRAALVAGATLAALAALAVPPTARAWTPKAQVVIAREAARLAPPDLWEQIDRHKQNLEEGVMAPFQDADAGRHYANPDGTGTLDRVIVAEVARAIQSIQALRPFEEVVFRLGVVSHYLADAENPLNTSDADPEEGRYFADYARYLERTEPRLPVVFYGLRPGFDTQPDPSALVADVFRRGRALYPLIGREYRRIGFASGVDHFDDRSTAFGVAALAFSHAVSDVGLVMRYIWVRAGGGDFRTGLPIEGHGTLRLPR